MKPRTSPPDEHLCFAIYSAFHAFTAAYRTLLQPLNLTYPQYLVLLLLWEQDRRRVRDIGDRLFLTNGTLTPLLKRLEELGYIKRTRARTDERQVDIALTKSGIALELKAELLHRDLVCMTGLEKSDIKDLMDRIVGLRGNLRQSTHKSLQADYLSTVGKGVAESM